MLEWMSGPRAADPARVHTEGRIARAAIEDARAAVAGLFGVRPRQCIFTSSATESVNSAVWGAVKARPGGAIVYPAVEHSCVREASKRLAPVVEVVVDGLGRVDLDAYAAGLDAGYKSHGPVALAHCQWGNHEIATLQPVTEVVAMARSRGVPTHVDAAAAGGHVAVDLGALGADLVSVSAHKLGGPKGVGALIVAPGLRLDPLMVGGEQERGRRAGMENTPAIVGFGMAATLLASDNRGRADSTGPGDNGAGADVTGPGDNGAGADVTGPSDNVPSDSGLRIEERRAWGQTSRILGACARMEHIVAFGDPTRRLPHIVCLGVQGVEAEAILISLDQAGIAAHSGSACSSESLAPSAVLEAIGADAEHSLRVSVGWSTTDADIDAFVEALPRVVDRLRALRAQ